MSLSSLLWDKAATRDIDIHVRHGIALKVRNSRCLVSSENVPEPLLGRPLLECLGLDTAEILATAANRSACVIEPQYLPDLQNTSGDGRISHVLDGRFHADGNGDDEYPDDSPLLPNNHWCDIGPESDEEWEQHLQNRLLDGGRAGISPKGRDSLEQMLRRNRDVVRIRLHERGPARVPPLKVQLKPDAVPLCAKPRR